MDAYYLDYEVMVVFGFYHAARSASAAFGDAANYANGRSVEN
jgi:hypothetical protein